MEEREVLRRWRRSHLKQVLEDKDLGKRSHCEEVLEQEEVLGRRSRWKEVLEEVLVTVECLLF